MTLTANHPAASLPATLRLGAAHLTVSDIDRSLPFYQDALGLQVRRDDELTAALHAGGEDILVLHENADAKPAGRHAGLYHVALLYPSREALGRALQRLVVTRTPIDGASDHGVSEAIYLPDPDGNGLELYADRPRDQWPSTQTGERVRMFVQPLDLHGLLAPVADDAPVAKADLGLGVGHMHLHVGDIDQALAFYRDTLGFELMTALPKAAFLAAGGYHHHLGVNTWRGEGVPGAPADAVGLHHWTLVVPDVTPIKARFTDFTPVVGGIAIKDPWGIELHILDTI